ncbi:uncharacterized protein LOC119027742 isoform X1 [Acanthopagrus latus]|uniref:uncharacterized protein LOC119027742 isoform X1 n=1 Tax=Acanthopagrus latus TaxID=8177 RepID=UPI00187CD4C3|nr:uncharacterized protein LOC119027742 isoform X1 [Acanthopagrus latus]
MAEGQQGGKIPIPRLAPPLPISKRRKKKSFEEKQCKKKELDRARNKTRINIGASFRRWRELQILQGLKSDAELAALLLDNYLRTKSGNQADRPAYQTSSPESCESLGDEYPIMMNSPIEVKQEVSPPPVQSSENGKHPQTDNAASQILNSQDESMTINQTEYEEDADMPEDDEVSISLSVGDGRYLVDLGSSSEFIIDEECILQLFNSCRECNRQCTVRKQVKGLKLTVSQKCCFCESSSKWTNLPDEDDDC